MSGKARRIVAVGVFVAIFVFLSLPFRVSRSVKEAITGLFTPLFSLTRSIGDRLSDVWDAAFRSKSLARESLKRERELWRLRAELALARERIRELSSLRDQLEELAGSGFELRAARVIGREPDNWYQTVLIDRGVEHGVGRGMPVVQGENLVGRITAVGGRWSRVKLILDPGSAVPAVTVGGEVTGLVIGAGPGNLKMSYIEHNARVTVGDAVVTAHLGKVLPQDEAPLPQGLVVGKIVSVQQEEDGLYQSATLESSVNFRNLSEVLVVIPK